MLNCNRIERGIKIYNPEKDQTLTIDNYLGCGLRIIINNPNIKDSKRGFNYFLIKKENVEIFEAFEPMFEQYNMMTYENDLSKSSRINFIRNNEKIYIEMEYDELVTNEFTEIQINSNSLKSKTRLNKYRRLNNCFYKLFMITKNYQCERKDNIKQLVKKRGEQEDE